jgi:hypothetical protein
MQGLRNRGLGALGEALGAGALALLATVLALALLAGAFWAKPAAGEACPRPNLLLPCVELAAKPVGETVPTKLPRSQPFPITLRMGFTYEALNNQTAPELNAISFEVSRNVTMQTAGLPSCPINKLYSSAARARRICAGSLVGHGTVTSEVALPNQVTAPVKRQLLAFYDDVKGQPYILAQVTSGPGAVPLTYVLPFRIENVHRTFGKRLFAYMPQVRGKIRKDPYQLKGGYGQISEFEIFLRHLFTQGGTRESFLSADCPAPGGQSGADFPLMKLALGYGSIFGASRGSLSGVVTRPCRVSR